MAECCWTIPVFVKDVGKSIITDCLCPSIKRQIDYWWCLDNNIQHLRDGVRDLDRERLEVNQRIEEARLRTEILRPGVENWSEESTEKLVEARRILADDNIPKKWNLISRYSKGKSVKKATEEIAKHRNDGNFTRISDPAPPTSMRSTVHRLIMDFESRKETEKEIIESLRDNSVSMIGICGMGGVGKTTMAQKIVKRVKEENLFDEVVMVTVSHQIDMLKIQNEIAQLLGLKFDVESVAVRADKLHRRLMDAKRKIIIFDDVWECPKFEDLGIPFESEFERCKVLFTSRSADACKGIKNKKVFILKILETDEAWLLFKDKAGDCVEDLVLHPVAKEVVAECKGLPIALVTVGMALQDEMKKFQWDDSLSQLRNSNPESFQEVLDGVYKPLKLSYNYLPCEQERTLFLLCCLFPEDYDIPVEQLSWHIMGLQIYDDISSITEARNRTYAVVERLKRRFLLMDGSNELHVKMHDVVRDVAIYIGSKEMDGFLKIVNKTSIESSSDVNCNWMSVDISIERMEVPLGSRFLNLRLLMLMRSSYAEFSYVPLEGIRDLNVLGFSDLLIGSLPPTLGLLKKLKTLYLFCLPVENISVIGELTSLEIFVCNECYKITELPAEIGRLNRLRLLKLFACAYLRRIPFGIISCLVRLEELKICRSFTRWETGRERRNAAITELECLHNLTCLEIEISDFNLAAQDIRLSSNLVKYSIRIAYLHCYDQERDYEKIMNVNLPGAVGNWIRLLAKSTESLTLEGDGSNNINLEECQNLRNLAFNNCSRVKKLLNTNGIVFRFLETLILYKVEKLEQICHGTILPNQLLNLKSIRIEECSNLTSLFPVSMARTSLLRLEVLGIGKCLKLKRVFCNEIGEDTEGCIEFPKLKRLTLANLPNLTAFCQGIQTIKFPKLTFMSIGYLPKLNSLCPLDSETPHDDTSFHFFCNPKVEIGGLNILLLTELGDNIRNIWCQQIPINFFNNLEELDILKVDGIRYLMSTSIAKNLVRLKSLVICQCKEIVGLVEGGDDDTEVVDISRLIPTLKLLSSTLTPKFRRSSAMEPALEMPLLEEIHDRGQVLE